MKNVDALIQGGIKTREIDKNKEVMSPWKLVTLGGVAGVLMGAGSLYTGQQIAKGIESDENSEENSEDVITDDKLKVAEVAQDISFGQAFASARAEVGPGGVFRWHGGIYNTFTAEEWNSMSLAEKNEFALRVQPEIHVNELSTPTDSNSQVIVVHHVYHHNDEEYHSKSNTEDVQVVNHQADDNDDQGGDVHIVGFTNVYGHLAVGFDIDNDNKADVAIIDVDDNLEISNPDLVIDKDGNMVTIGEALNNNEPSTEPANESLDILEDSSVETDYPLYEI